MELVSVSSEKGPLRAVGEETSEEGMPLVTAGVSTEMEENGFFEGCKREEIAATRRKGYCWGNLDKKRRHTGRIHSFSVPFLSSKLWCLLLLETTRHPAVKREILFPESNLSIRGQIIGGMDMELKDNR